ncbi:MAG: hypothetical protein ACKVS6_06400 [Planctomycetota bacterium]
MRHRKLLIFVLFIIFGGCMLGGCNSNKGPMTKAGEWVDEATKDTGNAIGDAGNAVKKTANGK